MKRRPRSYRASRTPSLLLWGVVAFAAQPIEAPRTESLPVEFVSANAIFADDGRRQKRAQADRQRQSRLPTRSATPKRSRNSRPRSRTSPRSRPIPPPPSRSPTKRSRSRREPQARSRSKAEPQPAEKAAAKDKPKPDQIAETLKKDEAKKPPKPEKKQPTFKPDQIAAELKTRRAEEAAAEIRRRQVAALLDHREPQRQVGDRRDRSTRRLARRVAAAMPRSCRRASLMRCARRLISVAGIRRQAVSMHPDQYVVTIRIRLTRDHRLVGQTGGADQRRTVALFERTRDSAVRAVFQAQPYRHAYARPLTISGRKSKSTSIRARFSVVDRRPLLPHGNAVTQSHHASSRTERAVGVLALGARAVARPAGDPLAGGGGASSSTSPRATSSRCRSRFPDFLGGSAGRYRNRAGRHADHHRRSQAQRPVRADRSGGLHREDRQHRRGAAFSATGARSTRRRWSPAASRARATAGSRPSSGCGMCSPASSSPASNISPRPTIGGASRTSSPMRSTSGSPARRAISTPASSSSTRPGRQSAASSGSRSWIRTAPMCAISRAATNSC